MILLYDIVQLLKKSICWEFCTGISTFLLFIVAWIQLNKISKTNTADFIHKFREDFFTKETRQIIELLSFNLLKFKNEDLEDDGQYPYFIIDNASKNKKIIDKIHKENLDAGIHRHETIYSAFEIDDNVLGHFEDLGNFEKKGIISIDLIYEGFDWYIESVWESCEIQKYLKWSREGENDDNDVYDGFEYIVEKCKSYRDAKNSHKWIWLWRLKWWLTRKILK